MTGNDSNTRQQVNTTVRLRSVKCRTLVKMFVSNQKHAKKRSLRSSTNHELLESKRFSENLALATILLAFGSVFSVFR